MDKEHKLLEMLNTMLKCLEPIKYTEFNRVFLAKNQQQIIKFEKEYPDFGLRKTMKHDPKSDFCTSSMAIIASITATLIGKRLCACFDEDSDIIIGFNYYEDLKKE